MNTGHTQTHGRLGGGGGGGGGGEGGGNEGNCKVNSIFTRFF